MPPRTFAIMLFVVIANGGLTVALISLGGIGAHAIAIPAVMIASAALYYLRK